MDFERTVRDCCYCSQLAGTTKREIIEEMVDLLMGDGKITAGQQPDVLKAILEREAKASTGLQHGVAVPHGKTNVVGTELVTALAFKQEGVDFASLDGEPSRIFVMTVSSVLRPGPHMKYLTEISRLLNSAALRERILAASGTKAEVIRILLEGN
jgi:PTS system nitrogen regulatory IIA component